MYSRAGMCQEGMASNPASNEGETGEEIMFFVTRRNSDPAVDEVERAVSWGSLEVTILNVG